jgi:cytochrome c2
MQRAGAYLVAIVAIVVVVVAVAWALEVQPLAIHAEATPGAYRYEAIPVGAKGPLKECVVCHSIESGGPLRVAPPLHGIVGARKARYAWYAYSDALRKVGGTWTEADLDKFLANPSKFAPGTNKTILGITDAKQRAEIIAALKKAP